jgi:GDP-mannose 6-dehydrogenase
MRISVFGLGYVGSISAACLARAGHDVWGVDINPEKVALLNAGSSPVLEPGLAALVAQMRAAGRLRGTCSSLEAVTATDLALVCVGTPGQPNGLPDFGAIERVAEDIGRAILARDRPYTVVIRSTVLPGTTERVVGAALARHARTSGGFPTALAVSPEFLREGTALEDFTHPPLTLIGCDDVATADQVRALFDGVEATVVHTSLRAAEMVKYSCNAFHALKICFANEIADVCAAFGTDGPEVMRIFRMDEKLNISGAYLRPGFAFGGSCLPKDVRALVKAARSADVEVPLLSAVIPSNTARVQRGLDEVLANGQRRVGVIGLAFKPGTDDLRESPSVAFVKGLIAEGRDVRIFDPHVSQARLVGANRKYIETELPHFSALLCDDLKKLMDHAQVLVVLHDDAIGAAALAAARPDQIIIDLTQNVARKAAAAPTAVRPSSASVIPSAPSARSALTS